MDRTDYAGMLPKLQPTQAVDILNDRVRQVGRLNTTIADWLQERSRLEEQYAAGLRKLARKALDDIDLGIFSTPWSALTNSLDTQADAHASLASKIDVDVEAPLRAFASSNREMQSMSTVQGNLAAIAKDIDKAQQKSEKLQGKGEKAEANKVANATSDLDNARAQWDSQAPYVFEQLQALDETRVNHLRDLLTQFETLEADQVEKSRVAAESCLNVLLNVETKDEIKTWSLKALASKPAANRSNRASFMPTSTPSRGASSSANALSTIPSNPEDDASQYSASTPEPSKKGGFKGLKRLGTVMSRRSSKQPQALPSTSESPERKPRSGPFAALRRNKDSYGLEPPQEESGSRRPGSPLRMGSEILEAPQSRQEPTSPIRDRAPQLDAVNIPHMNGSRSPTSAAFPNGSHQGDLADLDPPKPAQPEAPMMPTISEPQRDSQGYSLPQRDLDPISQAQADAAAERAEPAYNVNIRQEPIREEGSEVALANVATKLQAPPITQRRLGTVRGRRDARNSAVISTYGPPDQAVARPIAVAAPPTTERAVEPTPINTQVAAPVVQPRPVATEPSSNSLVNSPSGAFTGAAAGGSTFSSFSPTNEPQSPGAAFRPTSRAATLDAHDNQSIRSGRSTASQTNRHPDLQKPGLSSSIVETVSAKFESGNTVSSSIIGEIALAHNSTDRSPSTGQEIIRLDHFSSLDKVAPNPAFLSQNLDRDGEYSVNLATLGSKTQVAFKYQLRADDALTHTPLLLSPVHKITPDATMVIIKYSLHPNFAFPSGTNSVTLHNIMIVHVLEGARASGSQSKPPGTFAREKNLHFWNLGDVTLSQGAEPQQLLVKFTTESEATGGHIEAKWDISGDEAQALGSGLTVSAAEADHDPFADENANPAGGWKLVPNVKKLVSGNYVAKTQ
ncbi:Cytoskeletal protein syp1 [Fulvia fulva]|uniref:Cytoskeletal protein syp1 n=1 Tax=Passalora fulva TaxID=5499 RepID=A0A9Q8PFX2_PASFU|nr:Cytoskeletal protein syp1 [Fulvia fulva]UJO21694.1 Cytoskeletal protein syp1 [Fulvia fulva]